MKARFLTAVLISGILFGAANEGYAWPLPLPPIAELECPNNAVVGDSVILDGSKSRDQDEGGASITKYEWDFDYNDVVGFDCDYYEASGYYPDGAFDGNTTHTYDSVGDYNVMLRVTDNEDDNDTDGPSTIYVRNIVNITQDSNHPDIQAAIDYQYLEDGDVIVVAKGRYTGDGNRDIDFKGLGITIRSIDPNDPAVVAATIIDCNGTETEPNRGFYFHNSETANSVLAGFTITNGYVTSSSPGGSYGGGIYCNGSDPTITNCIFSGNLAATNSGSGMGGGMSNENSSPIVTNCIFRDNTAVAWGGGMENYNSSPTVTGCFFEKNKANFGGGMDNVYSSPTVVNCVFSENYSGEAGGGMHMYSYNSSSPRAKLVNCIFSANFANNYGGGMSITYAYYSSPTLVNCTFSRNSAYEKGGGIDNYYSSSPELSNCILWGNQAPTGPEIYNDNSNPTVSYCDINDCYIGGVWDSNLGIDDGNNIDSDPCFVDIDDPNGSDDVFGTMDDGLFLRTDSPCIDTGSNSAIEATGVTTDIIGNARIVDGNHAQEDGIWATVDMGAYELPTIWYVDAYVEGGDDNGTSWANAYDKLQDALTNENIKDGNEIWVADGTYYPDEDTANPSGTDDRQETFQLISGVGVYGGFSVSDTARIDRDRTLYETTLSGDINTPDQSDNSYHVVKGADDAILDGFTITGGNADGLGADGWGGGIYCSGVSPTISNCTIEDNNSSGDGGGMYNGSSSPTLINCTFSGNNAVRGGGMFNYSCASLTLTNCVFAGNTADSFGGGILNRDFSPTLINNCTFSGNFTYGYGGAMFNVQHNRASSPTVTNCIFWGNSEDEIYNSVAVPTFSYCDVNGCGGSGDNWDPNFGADGGGNIDSDPCFVDIDNPDGNDGIFGTLDDGLRLTIDSNCIDAADGYAAPATDILGRGRIDVNDVNNTGKGDPNYADIGAYEFFYDLQIVVMVWIDESYVNGGHVTYYWDAELYDTHLAQYRNAIKSIGVIKSGCLVPPHPDLQDTLPGIEPVLPEGYDPPPEISVEECNRPPEDVNEIIADFNRIRNGVWPDYVLLSVDNSGSMTTSTLGDAYPEFKSWLDDANNYAGPKPVVKTRDEPADFRNQDWVNEITKAIQDVLDELYD